jgi:hypothetical protein
MTARQKIFIFFGFVFSLLFLVFGWQIAQANNIHSTNEWAWNDVIGWLEFNTVAGDVDVSDQKVDGYADSSVGSIALDCSTSPNGNICAASSFKVSNSDGALSGWAWNDQIGWISFNCNDLSSSSPCATSNYSVSISVTTGDFSGWAWNDIAGWISFNCSNTATCGTVSYYVNTTWRSGATGAFLISSIFDSGSAEPKGVTPNAIMWQGALSTGTVVKFQIASSDSSSGPWTYVGSDGSTAAYYQPSGPGVQVKIRGIDHNNKRFFRYKIYMETNAGQTASPQIDDVIISYSP